MLELLHMAEEYSDEVKIIGKSELRRDIAAFRKGDNGKCRILIHGAIHAREYITARLLVKMLIEYRGDSEIWFIPLVNPDGVELARNNLINIPSKRHNELITINNNSDDFSLWKANINAVDLNVNFDALWGMGEYNIKYPSSENYIGKHPFSERETRALRYFTILKDFALTISYHTKGNEIYWGFDNNYQYKKQAQKFAEVTRYQLKKSVNSAGGYKDWFTLTTGRLGLTIEAGDESFNHPLQDDVFDSIYQDNKYVAELASEVAKEIIS